MRNAPKSRDYAAWGSLLAPPTADRPRGLQAIRNAISEDGLFVVVDRKRPSAPEEVTQLEAFFGARLVFAGETPPGESYRTENGVALYPYNHAPTLANRVRGTLNPQLGVRDLNGLLMSKWSEMQLAQAVDPAAVPETIPLSELSHSHSHRRRHATVQAKTERLKTRLRTPGMRITARDRTQTYRLLQSGASKKS